MITGLREKLKFRDYSKIAKKNTLLSAEIKPISTIYIMQRRKPTSLAYIVFKEQYVFKDV